MPGIRVVTDSTADIPDALARAWQVEVVPLSVDFDGERLRDGVEIEPRDFVTRLARSAVLPTTAHPPPAEFAALYRRLLAEGASAIVSIHISGKLSATVSAARAAASAPDLAPVVTVLDSKSVSLGLGFCVLDAARAAGAGLDRDAVIAAAQRAIGNVYLTFFADTLAYFQKGGQVGRPAAIAGTLLALKPLLRIDEGVVVPYKRTRTRARAIDGLVQFVADFPHTRQLAVVRSGDSDSDTLLERLGAHFPPERIIVAEVSPVIASHLGPGALGVAVDAGDGDPPPELPAAT